MEAEIKHKVLRPRKNLAFSEDTCLKKERVWPNMIQKKVGAELKQKGS